jgi:tRNA pseudouridine38-40 synthase
MARFFLTLSYDGTRFNGWQIQENTANTVEQLLEEKMSMILKEKIDLVGCGRTDTGVNARNFVAHFDSHSQELIPNKKHWIYKFNTVLPATVAIHDIQAVKEKAHARYDATQRVYYYYLSQKKDPFKDVYSYYVYGELDFELMNEAAAILKEYKDFTSFSKAHTQNKTNVCNITRASWNKSGQGQWRFTISADRFLRGMVRAIVGTLLLVGHNKITLTDFRRIIESRDRRNAGSNVPANALFLVGIKYPKELFI